MQRHRLSLREARHSLKAYRLADHVMATLNIDELMSIRDEEVLQPDRRLIDFKYFNIRPWMLENIKRALRLGLDHRRNQHILDIGTGFGYFPYVCEFLEHNAAALDIADHELYDRVIDTLKIDRDKHVVNPYEPLPRPRAPFDVVTAYQVAFNRPNTAERWHADEWAFFIDDILDNQLATGGRLHMELNWSSPIDAWYDTRTRKLFEAYGATRIGNEVDIVKK